MGRLSLAGLSARDTLLYAGALIVVLAASAWLCVRFFTAETPDSPRYLQLAANLAAGNGYSAATHAPFAPEVFRPPMYALFMAPLLLAGGGVTAIVVVQLVLYLVAVLLAADVGYRLVGSRAAALLLGVLLVLYLPIVRWVSAITTEALCTFLFCVACWLWLRWMERPALGTAAALGASLIALFLTRTTYVVMFPIIGVLALARMRDGAARTSALVLCVAMAAGPIGWLLRNTLAMPGSGVPFGVGSGMVLYGASLEVVEPDVVKRNTLVETNPDVRAIHGGSDPAMLVAADRRLGEQAMRVIRAHPLGYMWRTLKLVAVRQWIEAYDPRLSPPLRVLAASLSLAMLAMAYVGIYLGRRVWRTALPLILLCVAIAAIHALFTTEARYTAPVRPIIYAFSAFALTQVSGAVVGAFRQRPIEAMT